jgi:hypothetical protein
VKILIRLTLLSLLIATCVSATWADERGKHPYYLHALSDLRDARAHLEFLSPSERRDMEEEHAIREIDMALREIHQAAIDDGKPVGEHMPIDAHLKRTDRFHKALELLDGARKDVRREEDDPRARGLRDRALLHIDEAHHIIERIIHNY